MKLIHTADLHLGKLFHQYSRTEEYAHFFTFLLRCLREEEIDVLVVAGDIFDSANPTVEAQRLWYDFLMRAVSENKGLQVVITAGNHDSGARLEMAAEMARYHQIYIIGLVPRDAAGAIDFDAMLLPLRSRKSQAVEAVALALPFLRSADYPAGMHIEEAHQYYLEAMLRAAQQGAYASLPQIAVAHLFATGAQIASCDSSERLSVGQQDAVSSMIFPDDLAYVALGHIHKPQKIGARDNVRYAGAPLKLSFGERHYTLGVNLVELVHGVAKVTRLPYEAPAPLITLPEHGSATPAEALELLSAFPLKGESGRQAFAPFVEVRLRLSQPEPELRHQLLSLAQERDVRLCRIVNESSPSSHHQAAAPQTLAEGLSQLSPLALAEDFFRQVYGEQMRPALRDRFLIAQNSIDR